MRKVSAGVLVALLLCLSCSPVAAAKPDKDGDKALGKPGWGQPPAMTHGTTPPGQFVNNNPGGTPRPEPEPEPEPAPQPEPPIVGPDGLPPALPDTAMR